jgi:hypothetical protein
LFKRASDINSIPSEKLEEAARQQTISPNVPVGVPWLIKTNVSTLETEWFKEI